MPSRCPFLLSQGQLSAPLPCEWFTRIVCSVSLPVSAPELRVYATDGEGAWNGSSLSSAPITLLRRATGGEMQRVRLYSYPYWNFNDSLSIGLSFVSAGGGEVNTRDLYVFQDGAS